MYKSSSTVVGRKRRSGGRAPARLKQGLMQNYITRRRPRATGARHARGHQPVIVHTARSALMFFAYPPRSRRVGAPQRVAPSRIG